MIATTEIAARASTSMMLSRIIIFGNSKLPRKDALRQFDHSCMDLANVLA